MGREKVSEREGEWVSASRRKPRPFFERYPVRHSNGLKPRSTLKPGSNKCISYFFRNFPSECYPQFLRSCFNEVGLVVDLFIPQKKDKRGNPFGFVRFEMVADEVKLLEDLNNIWIGSYKIRASFPRYGRKSSEVSLGKKPEESKSFEAHRNAKVPAISYAVATVATHKTNGETIVSIPRAEMISIPRAETVIQFKSSEEEKAWLKECITGSLKKNFSWEDYQDEIQTEGGKSLLLRSLGDDVVLIQNLTGKPYEILMKEWDDWFSHWF
ncbi:hypothetical protein ACS0TY_012213 [Phlomoides rotata]